MVAATAAASKFAMFVASSRRPSCTTALGFAATRAGGSAKLLPLLDSVRRVARGTLDRAVLLPACRVMYSLCKVRGYKTIVKFVPHEVADLEPLVALLMSLDAADYASWQIAYSLMPSLASGSVFGMDQPVILHLLDIPVAMGALGGVVMELQDCALPLIRCHIQ